MSRCRAWGAFAGASYVMPPLSTPSRGPAAVARATACFSPLPSSKNSWTCSRNRAARSSTWASSWSYCASRDGNQSSASCACLSKIHDPVTRLSANFSAAASHRNAEPSDSSTTFGGPSGAAHSRAAAAIAGRSATASSSQAAVRRMRTGRSQAAALQAPATRSATAAAVPGSASSLGDGGHCDAGVGTATCGAPSSPKQRFAWSLQPATKRSGRTHRSTRSFATALPGTVSRYSSGVSDRHFSSFSWMVSQSPRSSGSAASVVARRFRVSASGQGSRAGAGASVTSEAGAGAGAHAGAQAGAHAAGAGASATTSPSSHASTVSESFERDR